MQSTLKEKLHTIQKDFEISEEKLFEISDNFLSDMNKKEMLRMFNTFICPISKVLDGEYITIDFGGSNIRMALFAIKDQQANILHISRIRLRSRFKDYTTSDYSLKDIFDIIAKHLSKITDHKKEYKLVHTFSFAFISTSQNNATLPNFTKGIQLRLSPEQDINKLLKQSFDEANLKITPIALINDTTSTLITGNFQNPQTDIAIIAGTGHNSCFISKSDEIINIESGYFSKKLPLTVYDKQLLTLLSKEETSQLFEILTAGKYMSKIAQQILKSLSLFHHVENISTSVLSMAVDGRLRIKYSREQKITLREIGTILLERSAALTAAEIFAIVRFIDPEFTKKHNVVFDGSFYEKSDYFRKCLDSKIELLFKSNAIKITHELIKDASSTGAALIAAKIS